MKIITPEMKAIKSIWYQRASTAYQHIFNTFIEEGKRKGLFEDEWDMIAKEVEAIKKNNGIFVIPATQTQSGQEERFLIFTNGHFFSGNVRKI